MAENPTAKEAPAPAQRRAAGRPAVRRALKLDAVLAAAVDSARAGVLTIAPAEQVGAHVGASAEGERLVLHRFEAKLAGYRGWHWFATVARVPRGKVATVCEVGLLPSDEALLAPEWVPWADRVRPEDVPQPDVPEDGSGAAEETDAAAGDGAADGAMDEDGAPEDAASDASAEEGAPEGSVPASS
ncbi:DUF3027 domain-containing protein [Arthrobacter mobilis]|uniref:DUF3027 domain-containing protein n=1 Tax=Arthrobacter mobilis TaxID=2724944 RepID=A0A7X6HFJ1_9MICC|nr:DUF3027 domain-containing protein [Arthrobacter mobilis]NKX56217.1 DUF3027 domain-containing protein [Arthrobacter mobilis]